MNFLLRAVAGAVIAATATFAAAQSQTLTFEEPPVPIGADLITYKGFTFSAGTADGWKLFSSGSPYSIPDGGNYNITGMGKTFDDTVDPPVQMIDAYVFATTNGSPFTLQGLSGCCGPVYLELLPFAVGATPIYLGWDGTTPTVGGIFTNDLGDPNAEAYDVPAMWKNTPLKEVAVWSFGESFAVDNIRVTVVPEPSSYLMMAAGLGVLVMTARRRKGKAQA